MEPSLLNKKAGFMKEIKPKMNKNKKMEVNVLFSLIKDKFILLFYI
jgi:hypothetical protein